MQKNIYFKSNENKIILAGTKELYFTVITQMKYVLLKTFMSKVHKGIRWIIVNPKMQKNMSY